MSRMIRIAHVSTVDLTLRYLLLGQMRHQCERGFDVTGISATGPWVADLEASGIRHLAWRHATRKWDPKADLAATRELVGILKRERFDLVHTHTPKAGIIGRIAARTAGVPCVVNTVHGFYAQPSDSMRKKAAVLGLEWLGSRCSDLELYTSAEDLAWAHRLRIARAPRSVHLGAGVDQSEYDPVRVLPDRRAALRRELGVPEEAVLVGTVCRLVAEKGVHEFISAAGELRSDRVRFIAVGATEPEKADALRREEVEAAGKDVIFTGWRRDTRDLLAVMDVFVLASWREGVPSTAIEAAAMGKPLVLTDVRGSREVARHGIEALFVPPRDARELARAIERLVQDPDLRASLGVAARSRAVESFDEHRVFMTAIDSYHRVLETKGVLGRDRGPLHVRRARSADVHQLARLHRETLPEGFMSALGERFLRTFYRALSEDDRSVVLVAEDGGFLVGLVTGSASIRSFSRRFYLRHAHAALSLLSRAPTVRGLIESARYAGGGPRLADAELVSLAVACSSRRRGIGKMLTESLMSALGELGARKVKLVTGASNDEANRFFSALSFRPAGKVVVHRGSVSNLWVADCRSFSPSA